MESACCIAKLMRSGIFKNNMHHPRSIRAARRLRIASLLLLGSHLLIPAGSGLLLYAVLAGDRRLMIYGLLGLITGILLGLAQWMAAARAGCPLCSTPVLAPMRCARHRKARRLPGSYPLRVATAILFTDQFRCPYCNEPTAMDVKERIRGSRSRGSGVTECARPN